MAYIPARVERLIAEPPYLPTAELVGDRPLYNKDTCSNGVICLDKTENKLNEDLISEKIHQCQPKVHETEALYYNIEHGSDRFRLAMAKFLTRYMRSSVPIDHNKLVVTTGASCALTYVALATAEAGDYYLVPSPCYFRIEPDIKDVAGINTVYVAKDNNNLSLADSIEMVYTTSIREGKTVRGVIVSNPDNPTGRVYSKAELMDVLHVCSRYNLHVVFDEVYALSVFSGDQFDSVLSFDNLPKPETVHFIWSASKDFGLSGYRIGVFYSLNEKVIGYLQKVALMFQLPMQTQLTLEKFLSDHDWIERTYLPVNLQKLKKNLTDFKAKLEELGVEVYPSKAGLYIWANFSKFLRKQTFEGERQFHRDLANNAGLVFVGGDYFHSTDPGWFRIVISYYQDHVQEGFARLARFLSQRKEEVKRTGE